MAVKLRESFEEKDLRYLLEWNDNVGVIGMSYDSTAGMGFLAPLANEPVHRGVPESFRVVGGQELSISNCCYASSPEGCYLVVCMALGTGCLFIFIYC